MIDYEKNCNLNLIVGDIHTNESLFILNSGYPAPFHYGCNKLQLGVVFPDLEL